MASVNRVDSFMAWPRGDRTQRGKMLPRAKTAVQAGAAGDPYRFRAAGNACSWPEAGRACPSAANPPRSCALSWLFAWRTGDASLRPGSYSCPFEIMIACFEPNASTRASKLFDSATVRGAGSRGWRTHSRASPSRLESPEVPCWVCPPHRAREYAGAGAPQSAGMPALCVNLRRAFETGRKVTNNLAVGNFLPGPRAFPAAPLASRPARELAPQMATWQMSPPH
jgi:hypothetical protein